jgi:VWFA-related protein
MKRTKRLAAALSACLALSAWPRASAQGAGGGDQRITLYINVTDKSRNPVAGLQHQDFTVLDNKRPQPISSFRAVGEGGKTDDSPVRVIFVIDEVNVSFRAIGNAQQHLEKYLRQAVGQLPFPMSLVIFNEKSTQVQGTPTRNGNVLADSVLSIVAGAPRDL